jgi:hypothetical protein
MGQLDRDEVPITMKKRSDSNADHHRPSVRLGPRKKDHGFRASKTAARCEGQTAALPCSSIRFKGGTKLDIESSAAITDQNWHHVAFSFDLTSTARRHIYLDGVDVLCCISRKTRPLWISDHNRIRIAASDANAQVYNGDLAEFWLDFSRYHAHDRLMLSADH